MRDIWTNYLRPLRSQLKTHIKSSQTSKTAKRGRFGDSSFL
nr:MAG TPA: hypothetical protein [Caudoviricetes sp.]